MKNIIYGMIFAIIFISVIFGITMIQTNSERKNETNQVLSHALSQSLENCYKEDLTDLTEEDLIAKITYGILSELTSDSDITIQILALDKDKGLIDVNLIETYKSTDNKKKTLSIRRTAILESYNSINNTLKYKVTFYLKDNSIYKSYYFNDGQDIVCPINIVSEWKFNDNSTYFLIKAGDENFVKYALNDELKLYEK